MPLADTRLDPIITKPGRVTYELKITGLLNNVAPVMLWSKKNS